MFSCEDTHGQPRCPTAADKMKPGDRIISQQEAAELRGVTRQTLARMAVNGIGPERLQLSPGRFSYRLSDFVEIEA
jgi:hypothetical protein